MRLEKGKAPQAGRPNGRSTHGRYAQRYQHIVSQRNWERSSAGFAFAFFLMMLFIFLCEIGVL